MRPAFVIVIVRTAVVGPAPGVGRIEAEGRAQRPYLGEVHGQFGSAAVHRGPVVLPRDGDEGLVEQAVPVKFQIAVAVGELVGVAGYVQITHERKAYPAERGVEPEFGVLVALPFQVRIVLYGTGLGIVPVVEMPVVVAAGYEYVPVARLGIEYVERGQFLGESPAGPQGEVPAYVVPDVYAGGEGTHVRVARAFDEDPVVAQSGGEPQAEGEAEILLGIGRQRMHERILGIVARPEAVLGEGRVEIVFALSHIAGSLPLQAGLERAAHAVPAAVERVFQRSARIEFPGVGHGVGIVFALRKQHGIAVAFLLGMHGRQGRGGRVVLVVVRELVSIVEICVEIQVGDPGAVQQPCERSVGSQGVVPRLGVFALERVGIVLAVHAAYVAVEPELEAQPSVEVVGPHRPDAPPGV